MSKNFLNFKSHQSISKIALDWFDKFLLGKFGKSMKTVLADLMNQKSDQQKQSKNLFAILQEFINYLELWDCRDGVEEKWREMFSDSP